MPWVGSGDSANWVEDAPPPVDPGSAQAAVTGWYEALLGRQPDAGGLQAYTNALISGSDPAQLVASIVNSQEAQNYLSSGAATPALQSDAQQIADSQTPNIPSSDLGTGGVKWQINPSNPAQNAIGSQTSNGITTYSYSDGSTAVVGNRGELMNVTPPYSAYQVPENQRLGYRNIPYSGTTLPDQVTINGQTVSVVSPELILTPDGQVYKSASGAPVTIASVSPKPTDGGLYGVFNTVIGLAESVAVSFIAPEVGAEILASTLTGDALASFTALTQGGMSSVDALTFATNGLITSSQIYAVGTAATGAFNSGFNAAVQGKDPTQIIEAAATSAVGAGVGYGTTSALGDLPTDIQKPLASTAQGFSQAQLSGSNLEQSLQKGATAGLGALASEGLGYLTSGLNLDPSVARTIELTGGGLASSALSGLLNPTRSASTVSGGRGATTSGTTTPAVAGTPTKSSGGGGGGGFGSQSGLSSTGVAAQASPGSQALGQALRTGDPGAAIADPETGGPQQNVWNQASLRVKDETGSGA